MSDVQTAKLKQSILTAIDNSRRLMALQEACGYYQNGTQETIKIYQDDATREVFISSGKKTLATGSSLMSALSALIEVIDAQSQD
jgi:hypothetical protein